MKIFVNSIPIYLQVLEEIENSICFGLIKDGEMLPSIRQLSKEYQINQQTVSRAFSELLQNELVFKKRGIGLFVKEGAMKNLFEKRKMNFKEQKVRTFILEAQQLKIGEKEIIEIIKKSFNDNKTDSKKRRTNELY